MRLVVRRGFVMDQSFSTSTNKKLVRDQVNAEDGGVPACSLSR